MKKVIVASTNPVKIKAVENAFRQMFFMEEFVFTGISAKSEVSDQPMTDQETIIGAINRVKNSIKQIPNADYWVGLEGGLELTKDEESGMRGFAWMFIASKDKTLGQSRTATFSIPKPIAELILQGKELGEADDIVFARTNSKQENGAVGILTENVIDRAKYYEHALILALIPFKNKKLF